MKFAYLLFRALVFIINLLPLSILYFKSDVLAPALYYLVRYRKKVITGNLTASFPEKSAAEIQRITRKFYRNLSDILFETLRLPSTSNTQLAQMVQVGNVELLSNLAARNRGAVLVMSHTGNWELVSRMLVLQGSPMFDTVKVIAKEMSNPYIEKFMTSTRLGNLPANAGIMPFTNSSRHIAAIRNTRSLIIAIADQTPHVGQIQYRTLFMNRNSAVFLGPERIARALGYVVVFAHVTRTGRGRYRADLELITDHIETLPEYAVTDAHVKLLEDDIRHQPAEWLWSHRRWKY